MNKAAQNVTYTLEFGLELSQPVQDFDSKLAHRLEAGDARALHELVSAYGQRMYAYALRLTGDPLRADDVVQESLVAAWQGVKGFRGTGSLLAWLLGIVHHKAMSSFRKSARTFEDEFGDALSDLPAQDPLLEEQAVTSEQQRLLRSGLESLSPEHRAVLELVFYQRLSLQETAHVCGVPLGTVKSRLNYAKSRLRGVLNRAGLSVEDVE